MKKMANYIGLTLAGICCIVAAYFCQFYYHRYKTLTTSLEGHVSSFEQRLASLENHKSRELTPVRVWGKISTTDLPPDEHMKFYDGEKPPGVSFEIVNSKGGTLIRPELRLPAGATNNCEFALHVWENRGYLVDAWLSHAAPYQDLASFEEFRVVPMRGTNIVRLIARPKPGASIQMRFEILVLGQK